MISRARLRSSRRFNSRTPQATIAFDYAYDPAQNYLSVMRSDIADRGLPPSCDRRTEWEVPWRRHHGPESDISKYDRTLPNVPESSAAFDVTFEPENFLAKVSSSGRWFAPDQREEFQIQYREPLSAMPMQPGLDQDQKIKPFQP